MDNNSIKVDSSELFRKNNKGEIVILGSGNYLRNQKNRFLDKDQKPFEKLYKQQVNDALKDSSESVRAWFTI